MASRSRAYTRPGADPEGRFRPAPSPELVERAAELQRALAPVDPSATVKSEAWYGNTRANEKVFLPGVWIGILTAVFAGAWLLESL